MIKTRLKKSEPCTWRELYDALNHLTVDMPSVADKLKPKLPKSESDRLQLTFKLNL